MKHLSTYLAILALTVLASCRQRWNDGKPKSEPDNAALELYYKYADSDLTVAYLGDFSLNGNKIDALMIQSNDSTEWHQIKLDFGMVPRCDSLCCDSIDCNLSVCPDDQKKMAISVGIDTDFLFDLGLDTITDLSQVDEERYKKMTDIIAGKIRGIVSSISDSIRPNDAVIVGENTVAIDGSIVSMNEYVQTLAIAVSNSLLTELIRSNTLANDSAAINEFIEEHEHAIDSTMKSSRNYGHSGYISAADDCSMTLWLFFYDNQEECNVILTHIKDDLLIGKQ